MENMLYSHVSVGHPKLCRDPEMCAPLLTDQSDLVWRGERERARDSPALTADSSRGRRRQEGAGSGAKCENVLLGSLRRCIIHQDSSVCL